MRSSIIAASCCSNDNSPRVGGSKSAGAVNASGGIEIRVARGADVCAIMEAWGSHGLTTEHQQAETNLHISVEIPGVSSSLGGEATGSCFCVFAVSLVLTFVRPSNAGLRGLRVRVLTVIVSRVVLDVLSVRLSAPEPFIVSFLECVVFLRVSFPVDATLGRAEALVAVLRSPADW